MLRGNFYDHEYRNLSSDIYANIEKKDDMSDLTYLRITYKVKVMDHSGYCSETVYCNRKNVNTTEYVVHLNVPRLNRVKDINGKININDLDDYKHYTNSHDNVCGCESTATIINVELKYGDIFDIVSSDMLSDTPTLTYLI